MTFFFNTPITKVLATFFHSKTSKRKNFDIQKDKKGFEVGFKKVIHFVPKYTKSILIGFKNLHYSKYETYMVH